MNFKKFIFKSAILSVFAFSFVACSDDDDPNYWVPPLSTTQGAFIINNGTWGHNDGSIAYYDKETGTCSEANVFESMNNDKLLGDTPQDMLIIDNKMYIAVANSGVIYITDLKCAVLDSVKSEKNGELQQPRALTTYGSYIYVSYYDGYVGRINKNTGKLDTKQVAIGRNPEELKIANGKIYVANSGGMSYPDYDKTVSVVDISSFSKLKDIEVIINPSKVEVDKSGNIYVISMGNYSYDPATLIPSTLQRIDTEADTVHSVITEASYMCISPKGDKLHFLNSSYSSTMIEAKTYDVATAEVEEGSFIDESVTFTGSPSSLNIDPQTNDFYIGSTMYVIKGDMTIISGTTGKQLNRFSTDGFNPMGAYFIK